MDTVVPSTTCFTQYLQEWWEVAVSTGDRKDDQGALAFIKQ